MIRSRLIAGMVALALGAGLAAAQTVKTPAQLQGASSAQPGDILMLWPIAGQGGPLESIPFGTLQSQVEANLLGSAQTFRSTLGVTGLLTAAGGVTSGGLLGFSSNPAQVGPGATSGVYFDGSNAALRSTSTTGTVYLQPSGGASTFALFNAAGETLTGALVASGGASFAAGVSAPTFTGALAGNAATATSAGSASTASNASALQGETLSAAATASSVAGRDGAGNLYANTFVGALSGNATSATTAGSANSANTATSANSVPAGTITAAMMAAGAAQGNLGYAPLNRAGDTATGAQNTSVNVGAAPSSVDAGQIGAMIDTGYSGEQRAVTWGVAPDGAGYVRSPHGPIELWANATEVLQLTQNRAIWMVSPSYNPLKFSQLDSAPYFGEVGYITDCPNSPQALGFMSKVTGGGGSYDCKLEWNPHDGAWEVIG